MSDQSFLSFITKPAPRTYNAPDSQTSTLSDNAVIDDLVLMGSKLPEKFHMLVIVMALV